MPRGKRSTNALDTAPKRAALKPRHEPYWHPIRRGLQLGYWQPASGPGTWRSRSFVADGSGGGYYAYGVIGPAAGEGARASDDGDALDYDAAAAKAIASAPRFRAESAVNRSRPEGAKAAEGETSDESGYRYETSSPRRYTIEDLLHDHARALRVEGKPSAAEVERNASGPIFAPIAHLLVARVTAQQLNAWREAVALSAPLRRSAAGSAARLVPAGDGVGAEASRRRRVRANRLITDLKAAFARVALVVSWIPGSAAREFAALKKFKDVGRGRVRPLDADEVSRLLAAIDDERFKDLVRGALLTGARVAELARLRVVDFNRDAGKVRFQSTKDEPEVGRVVALSPEGVELFARLTAGRPADALVFESASGRGWTKNLHIRPMRVAVERAGLSPLPHRVSFHSLRDTFACSLLSAGVSMDRVSKILGHSSVLLTERHYGKFTETDLDAAARSLPRFEQPPAKVYPIRSARRRHRA